MKIAAISDIHSNVFALEAVIADIEKRNVDITVNLGDILYGPIAPLATYELLMKQDFVTISGNQDRQIYQATETEINNNPTLSFILEDLGQRPLDWMTSLPFDKQLTDDVYLCHGTPENDLVYLLENVDSGTAQVRKDKDIITLLNGQSSDIVFCGHTHIPRTVSTSTGQLIINPGSVGLPAYTDDEPVIHTMETLSPHASYAIAEQVSGNWNVHHIKVGYDADKAAQKARTRGRKDWAHFLTTGRGLP